MPPIRSATVDKPLGVEFAIGAIAAVGAVWFTNPADVLKIRLQLQGELAAKGSYEIIYKNTFHAAYVIAKHEGLWALQAGIMPAMGFQVILNGIRLGAYHGARRHNLIQNDNGDINVLKTILVSGTSSSLGAIISTPLFMAKTRLQAQSGRNSVPNANMQKGQHYTGASALLKSIWNEGGLVALYRGWYINIPRIFMGSAVQLTTFGLATDWLNTYEILSHEPAFLTFLASMIAGSALTSSTVPFDVIGTRLYNQNVDAKGRGELYNGMMDAFVKIIKKEGIMGLYKGFFASWMRQAPHVILCQVFYDKLARIYSSF